MRRNIIAKPAEIISRPEEYNSLLSSIGI